MTPLRRLSHSLSLPLLEGSTKRAVLQVVVLVVRLSVAGNGEHRGGTSLDRTVTDQQSQCGNKEQPVEHFKLNSDVRGLRIPPSHFTPLPPSRNLLGQGRTSQPPTNSRMWTVIASNAGPENATLLQMHWQRQFYIYVFVVLLWPCCGG